MAGPANVSQDDPDELTEDGHRFLDDYAGSGDEEDLRRALAAYERALEVLPPGEEAWTFLSNLGNCLRMVHEEFDDPRALARAVKLLEEASGQVSPGTADHALALDNLALALRDRFAVLGDASDLSRAVDLHGAAVVAYGGGPELSRYLNNLGGAWWELYGRTGDLAHLEHATACFEASVAATPANSPDRSRQLSNLASARADQYRAGRDVALLDRALDAARDALAVPGADVTDRGRMLSGLAGLLLERFDAHGGLADLDEAVDLLRAAVADAGPHARRYAMWLNNLGEALLARFERTGAGAEADLDESVDVLERALHITAEGSAEPGIFQSSLGGALAARYLLRGDQADLHRAIELTASAVASIPAGAEAAAFAVNRKHNLGTLLRQRYEARGDVADLEAAARWFRESADLTPPGSPAMARRQAALGNALRDIYGRTGEFQLLDDAIGVTARRSRSPVRKPRPAPTISTTWGWPCSTDMSRPAASMIWTSRSASCARPARRPRKARERSRVSSTTSASRCGTGTLTARPAAISTRPSRRSGPPSSAPAQQRRTPLPTWTTWLTRSATDTR